ncbi:MAG: N-acetyltransferase [Candidatus Altiarchaeota archaeon]
MQVKIRKAKLEEAKIIKSLLDGYESENVVPRALSYLYENIRDYFVAEEEGEVVGCAALHVSWGDLAEVKSLAVANGKTKKGIGTFLVETCLKEAKEMGFPKVFTLTAVPEFFEGLGFKRIDKNELPIKIWGECMDCIKYPDCCEEALMKKI